MPRHPRFDRSFRVASALRGGQPAFATARDDEADRGAEVFAQDYHLALVPAMLRRRRPDLRIAHFTHCPWADPGYFMMLPAGWRGHPGGDARGRPAWLLVPRWARTFLHCCPRPVADFEQSAVTAGDGRRVRVRTYLAGGGRRGPAERADQADARAQERVVADLARGRSLIVRVDCTGAVQEHPCGLEGHGMFLERNPRAQARPLRPHLPSRRDPRVPGLARPR